MGSENKKVGLLNFHYSNNNYGAVLQAAALFRTVQALGYEVEQIDFIPHTYNVNLLSKSKRWVLSLFDSSNRHKQSINNKCFEIFK